MDSEENLYKELVQLRKKLREEHTAENGKAPQICSDEALMEMARRMPTKLEDLTAIDGIGQRFAEVYGNSFLAVTRRYAVTAAKGAKLDDGVAGTLRELQKKLVNVSKGNRLLFMPRTGAKSSYDLTITVQSGDVLDFLFGRRESLTVCDRTSGKEDAKAYTRVNNIFREVNRDVRERGSYDLYIAYPFCEGRLEGDEEFCIRAPLALFPVRAERHSSTFVLTLDSARDIVYNTTLLLAFMKTSRHNRPLPDSVIEEPDRQKFMDELLAFYASAGLKIGCDRRRSALEKFTEYRASQFPRYGQGEMMVVFSAVLGKFPSYSNFIQRDFDEMLSGRAINSTLADLIKDLNKEDYYADGPAPLSESDMKKEGIDLFTSAADVICGDGHVTNKVGTYQIAIAAKYHDIPYYVTGSPDLGHPTIDTVRIEMRDPSFVLQAMGTPTANQEVKGYYPAFDITPPELVTGVVTDQGIFSPYKLDEYDADAGAFLV